MVLDGARLRRPARSEKGEGMSDLFWPFFIISMIFYWWGYRTGKDHGKAEGIRWCMDQDSIDRPKIED
jgi:hypothetical protein